MAKSNGARAKSVDDSITFSIRAYPGDSIGRRYHLASLLDVTITSPFRRDLALYDALLAQEEEALSTRERITFTEIVRTLALNAAIRSEAVPSRGDIVRYLQLAGKEKLTSFIANTTTLRLFLIVDRAREHAGRIAEAAPSPSTTEPNKLRPAKPQTDTDEVSDVAE